MPISNVICVVSATDIKIIAFGNDFMSTDIGTSDTSGRRVFIRHTLFPFRSHVFMNAHISQRSRKHVFLAVLVILFHHVIMMHANTAVE